MPDNARVKPTIPELYAEVVQRCVDDDRPDLLERFLDEWAQLEIRTPRYVVPTVKP